MLSVPVTGPSGAIGVSLPGERVLVREGVTGYRFITLRSQLKLPRVGQRVRQKESGALWKVIEEKERRLSQPHAGGGPPRLVWALSLRFGNLESDLPPGKGKTLRHAYLPGDTSFDRPYKILEASIIRLLQSGSPR